MEFEREPAFRFGPAAEDPPARLQAAIEDALRPYLAGEAPQGHVQVILYARERSGMNIALEGVSPQGRAAVAQLMGVVGL